MNYGKHRSERDDPWDSRIRRQPGIGEFARGIANIFDVCFFIFYFFFYVESQKVGSWRVCYRRIGNIGKSVARRVV